MEVRYIEISPSELEDLKALLSARLDIFRGTSLTGSAIDTVEFGRAEDVHDLADADEFADASSEYGVWSVDFLFEYPGRGDVRLRVSTRHGSIWFRSAVTEEVIAHVFENLMTVKGLP